MTTRYLYLPTGTEHLATHSQRSHTYCGRRLVGQWLRWGAGRQVTWQARRVCARCLHTEAIEEARTPEPAASWVGRLGWVEPGATRHTTRQPGAE
jgi:hypothetical protein